MSHRQQQPYWNELTDVKQFDEILLKSKTKPALVLKYLPGQAESLSIKNHLDSNWAISPEQLDVYLINSAKNKEVSHEVTEVAGVDDNHPQVLLFADGVTMYDESNELINVKKIGIALKIINRTFKWMETRV